MIEMKRLIFKILDLLAILENRKNQPIINQARGYLYEILDILKNLK